MRITRNKLLEIIQEEVRTLLEAESWELEEREFPASVLNTLGFTMTENMPGGRDGEAVARLMRSRSAAPGKFGWNNGVYVAIADNGRPYTWMPPLPGESRRDGVTSEKIMATLEAAGWEGVGQNLPVPYSNTDPRTGNPV